MFMDKTSNTCEHIDEKGVGHAAVSATQASSVTLLIWQHGAKVSIVLTNLVKRPKLLHKCKNESRTILTGLY